MTSPYHALAGMGLHVSVDGEGALILGGLKNLSPEEREAALALARERKPEIVGALHERVPPAGHSVFPEPGQPRLWPVLWELIEGYRCAPLVLEEWPASVVLCFAAGVLANEKRAALRYAVTHWQALLADMALPSDGSIRHCWIEGYEYYCRPGNVQEAEA